MGDDQSKIPDAFEPPRKKEVAQSPFDEAEMVALRTIVVGLVGFMASENERNSGQPAQVWINNFAEICADAILNAEMKSSTGASVEDHRSRVLKHMNTILGGVEFPKIKGGN
jgi:hypothetical protein